MYEKSKPTGLLALIKVHENAAPQTSQSNLTIASATVVYWGMKRKNGKEEK